MAKFPLKTVVEACAKAFMEGRLGYQRGHKMCWYVYDDGACCAIGAAIGPFVLPEDMSVSVGGLNQVYEDWFDKNELAFLQRLQDAHDTVCGNLARPSYLGGHEAFVLRFKGVLKELCEMEGVPIPPGLDA